MRGNEWPFKAIRDHLNREHRMQTSETALRTFRRRRSIPKGAGSGTAEPSAARHPAEPRSLSRKPIPAGKP